MGHVTEESLHVCVVYLLSSVYTMNLEIHNHHHVTFLPRGTYSVCSFFFD